MNYTNNICIYTYIYTGGYINIPNETNVIN
jgi:hypothetical protein